MTFRVRFHPAVTEDLRNIARSLLPHAGPTITARIISELRDAARSLEQTPHRGSLRPHLLPGLRAIPAGRRGLIAFTVDDEAREVFVHIISYGGANWMARIPGRPRG